MLLADRSCTCSYRPTDVVQCARAAPAHPLLPNKRFVSRPGNLPNNTLLVYIANNIIADTITWSMPLLHIMEYYCLISD